MPEEILAPLQARHFEEALDTIVNSPNGGTWKERKEQLLSELSADAAVNLAELAEWFDDN